MNNNVFRPDADGSGKLLPTVNSNPVSIEVSPEDFAIFQRLEIDELKTENEMLKLKLEVEKAAREGFEKGVQEEAQRQIAEQIETNNRIGGQLEEATVKIQQLRAENERLKAQEEGAKIAYQTLIDEKEEFRLKLEKTERLYRNAIDQIQSQHKENERLKAKIEEMAQVLDARTKKLVEKNKKWHDSQTQLAERDAVIVALREGVKKAKSEINSYSEYKHVYIGNPFDHVMDILTEIEENTTQAAQQAEERIADKVLSEVKPVYEKRDHGYNLRLKHGGSTHTHKLDLSVHDAEIHNAGIGECINALTEQPCEAQEEEGGAWAIGVLETLISDKKGGNQ